MEYAADKLSLLAEDLSHGQAGLQKYDLKSKVIVLLTDGEPTVGNRGQGSGYPDEETIKKLADGGIKVYFVQILSQQQYRERPDGTVEVILPRSAGMFARMQANQVGAAVNQAIDEARKLARRTGGKHFLATSGDQVKQVYEQINRLERSNVGGRTVLSREESYGDWLFAAVALLVGESVLSMTWLRRSP